MGRRRLMLCGCTAGVTEFDNDSFEYGKKQLFRLATTQYGDGSFLYSFRLGDVDLFPMWFIHLATNYIKETGHFEILDENLPFIGKSFTMHFSSQYGSVIYKPGESPLYYHLEYAFDTICRQLTACPLKGSLNRENIIAAGLFSFVGKDYLKMCGYSDIYIGEALAAKRLGEVTSLFKHAFSDMRLLPNMKDFLYCRKCRCHLGTAKKKCYCEEINLFVKSHILGVISLFSRKTAGEYWLNTLSVWNRQETLKWIIGIKPGFDGLYADPCMPDTLSSLTAKRCFRNALYEISVSNPFHSPVEVKKLVVDNVEYLGNTLPNFADGKSHTAEVVMGVF